MDGFRFIKELEKQYKSYKIELEYMNLIQNNKELIQTFIDKNIESNSPEVFAMANLLNLDINKEHEY